MARRLLWVTWVCCIALASTTPSMAIAQDDGEDPGRPKPKPSLELAIDTEIHESGEATTEVRLRVPLSHGYRKPVEVLRATRASSTSSAYRDALVTAFRAGGYLSQSQATVLTRIGGFLPSLQIADGTATLTATAPFLALWGEGEEGLLILDRIDVPDASSLNVELKVSDAPLSARPLPDADDSAGTLAWSFPSGVSPRIVVRLSEPISPTGEYSWKMPIVSFVAGGLPFVFLLFLVAVLGRNRRSPVLSRLAWAGIAVSAACAIFFVTDHLWDRAEHPLRSMLAPSAGIALFVALPLGRSRVRLIGTGALALAFCWAVVADPDLAALTDPVDITSADLRTAIACILGAGLTTAVLVATGLWLRDALPRLASWTRGSPWIARTLIAVLAVLVLGIVAQFLLTTRANADIFESGPAAPGWRRALELFLETYPFQLANLARNLALTLMGVALSAWLWQQAGKGELRFDDWRRSALLALLFATAVIGIGGQMHGYAVPLAFLIALVAVTVVLCLLASTTRGKRALDSAVSAESQTLLERSAELVRVDRQKHSLADRLIAHEIEETEYTQRMGTLAERRDTLLSGPILDPIGAEDRPREALALGLAGGDGARSRMRTLVRDNWWVLAVPAIYSAYALLDLRAADAVSGYQTLGLAFLGGALVDQMLMWAIAAWCFVLAMPLIPGRIGPLKGLAAGALSAVPPLLASPFLADPPGSDQWLFLTAELTLLFVVVGFALDRTAVRRIHGDMRQLGELYSITNVRAALVYLAPLAVLLFTVIQGLATGSGASALGELVTNASSLVPPGR